MIRRILVANRGEIAARIARTCRRVGIETVAAYSDADRIGWHVASADLAVRLGPPSAVESYLSIDRVLDAARRAGVDAIHPGYGFLSENATFARRCAEVGFRFIGPRPEQILALGSKSHARRIADALGVPVLPGYDGDAQDDRSLADAADRIGFPVLIKASAGGGGRGMRVVRTADAIAESLQAARREALAGFGDDRLVLERYIERARHIEVQVAGDGRGHCIHLGDRECSVQRAYQKVVEEAPAPALPDSTRQALHRHAIAIARHAKYESLGTVEFIVDSATDAAYFLEMNTRIQVEHPVSEMVTGLDLVELQLYVAVHSALPITQDQVRVTGAAVELRILAERPDQGFAPQSGVITRYREPAGEGLRIDTGVGEGTEVTVFYDSMLAKLVAWDRTRSGAIDRALAGLRNYRIDGIGTNIGLLERILRHERFRASTATTRWLDEDREALAPRIGPDGLARLAGIGACALVSQIASASAASPDPWQRLSGWRITARAGFAACSTWRLVDENGRTHRIRVAARADRFAIDDDEGPRDVELACIAPGRFLVADGGAAEIVDVMRDGRLIRIVGRADAALFTLAPPIESISERARTGSDASTVCAPLPGAIVEVRVAVGDPVDAGTTVAAIESMKMVHSLVAPVDGRVAEILCAPGDVVAQGACLMVLEPARDG